ncbi:acyl-CoA dehydrogenase family protein [Serinibacter arcticus]|uniref:Acyl-CoA dehydrogenase, short-chain specific n=1 Tax=Serinibacter arcticus TaxID=1655435 RepID=A0A4Z1E4M2_9MICO|nr:acyl-CoA dehydrogenase family protein [Serinibacter arcticus]TGO05722.1 Acyl-CoA dehydrogenase, short-chain specific [Serinibacter arcticus]
MARTIRTLLTDDVLARIHERAPAHDAENTFPHADLEELASLGYLRAFVPEDLGGAGFTLEEVAREQMRLAAAAPATALCVGMHLAVTGLAARLDAGGDDSVAFILREAAAGEIFAFGNSEAGNDLVMFDSLTRAVPDGEGGYRFHGTKIFTSLAPVWTRLATFGRDDTDPAGPRLVHAVVTREGTSTKDDWNTLGMRATQSRSTVLDGAHAPADRVYRSLPIGPSADPFVFALFATFEVLIAAVYTGLAGRAVELGAEAAHRRRSRRNDGATYAVDPDIRWTVAAAAMRQDGARLQVLALARDVDEGADHGARWFAQLVGLKVRAVEDARAVVDQVVRVSGGASYANGSEIGRLYRDVLAGIFHPSDEESAHGTIATSILGPLP